MTAAAAAAAAIGFGLDAAPGSPTTPGGSAAVGVVQQGGSGGQSQSKKEINPKMILGKADQRETQCVNHSVLLFVDLFTDDSWDVGCSLPRHKTS
jgi:hypothetical protein